MTNNMTDRMLGGKLIWLPMGILLVCILCLCVIFSFGEAWFNPYQLITFGLWGSLLTLISALLVGYLLFRFAKQHQEWLHIEQQQEASILHLLDEMSTLAEGDLTIKATVSEDMTGAIADSVNFAVEALRGLVLKIDDTSGKLTRYAEVTHNRIDHLSKASSRQSEEIAIASSAIDAMTQSIYKVSRNAATSSAVANKSLDISKAGAHTVRIAIEDMVAVRDQIQATSKRIKRLGETSQEVGDIVRLMNDIAEQTNILALNASIQTTGSSGSSGSSGAVRSFERVTDEVQQLAKRSAEASHKIDVLVRAIQTDTHEAIASMEKTTAKVVAGSRNAEAAEEALDEVEEVSTSLARLIANISDASAKQADVSGRVTNAMKSISEVTQQTEQSSKETIVLVSSLNETSAELRRSISDFTISRLSVDHGESDHDG